MPGFPTVIIIIETPKNAQWSHVKFNVKQKEQCLSKCKSNLYFPSDIRNSKEAMIFYSRKVCQTLGTKPVSLPVAITFANFGC